MLFKQIVIWNMQIQSICIISTEFFYITFLFSSLIRIINKFMAWNSISIHELILKKGKFDFAVGKTHIPWIDECWRRVWTWFSKYYWIRIGWNLWICLYLFFIQKYGSMMEILYYIFLQAAAIDTRSFNISHNKPLCFNTKLTRWHVIQYVSLTTRLKLTFKCF